MWLIKQSVERNLSGMWKNKNRALFLLLSHFHPPTRGPKGFTSGPARQPVCQCYSQGFECAVTGANLRRQAITVSASRCSQATPAAALTNANIWSCRIVLEQQWCCCSWIDPEMCPGRSLRLIYGFWDEVITCFFVCLCDMHGLCMKLLMLLCMKQLRCCWFLLQASYLHDHQISLQIRLCSNVTCLFIFWYSVH